MASHLHKRQRQGLEVGVCFLSNKFDDYFSHVFATRYLLVGGYVCECRGDNSTVVQKLERGA